MVGSWNVGNNQMEEDQMKFWVPEGGGGFDMIVVGVQECSYKLKDDKTKDEIDDMLQEYTEDLDDVALKLAGGEEAAKENDAKLALRTPSRKRRSSVDGIMARGVAAGSEGKSAEDLIKQEKIEAAAQVRNDKSHSHFERCIELALGLNYVKIESLHGGPMKIICYAHKKMKPFITEVESNYECVAGARGAVQCVCVCVCVCGDRHRRDKRRDTRRDWTCGFGKRDTGRIWGLHVMEGVRCACLGSCLGACLGALRGGEMESGAVGGGRYWG